MADIYPTEFPAEITSGDTLRAELSFPDYSAADSWALAFSFANASFNFSFSGTAFGSAFRISTSSGGWDAGTYKGVGKVSKSGEVFTVWRGTLVVLPAFGEITDTRTHAEIVLDKIEAVLEGTASREILNSTINGQTLQWIPYGELLMLRDRYRQEVKSERAAEQVAQGLGSSKTIRVRFGVKR